MESLVDCHAHVSPAPYPGQIQWLEKVFQRCHHYKVSAILFSLFTQKGRMEMDLEELKKIAREASQQVEVAVGFTPPGYLEELKHPEHWESTLEEALSCARKILEEKKAIAVGEVGLDYYWPLVSYLQLHEGVPENKVEDMVSQRTAELLEKPQVRRCLEWQKEVLRRWVGLAKELNLPLVIHDRGAFEDILSILEESSFPPHRVMFHCYSSTPENALSSAQKGYFLSLPASTIKNPSFQAAAKAIPLENLLLETDSPYQSPIRGIWSLSFEEAEKRAMGENLKGKEKEKYIQSEKMKIFQEMIEKSLPRLSLDIQKDGTLSPLPFSEYFQSGKHRNQNESTFVRFAALAVSLVKGCSLEEVCKKTRENAARLFGI